MYIISAWSLNCSYFMQYMFIILLMCPDSHLLMMQLVTVLCMTLLWSVVYDLLFISCASNIFTPSLVAVNAVKICIAFHIEFLKEKEGIGKIIHLF